MHIDALVQRCYTRGKGSIKMRTTITINDKLYRALKMRAAETDESISKFVEDAVKFQVLEDFEDIEDAQLRKDEPEYSFDTLVEKFKSEGLL